MSGRVEISLSLLVICAVHLASPASAARADRTTVPSRRFGAGDSGYRARARDCTRLETRFPPKRLRLA